MEKVTETVYYYTYINDKGEPVRPRRPGTLAAIKHRRIASATPLMRTALAVDANALDEDGFYPRASQPGSRNVSECVDGCRQSRRRGLRLSETPLCARDLRHNE